VAQAAERRAGDRLDEQAGLLANHWEAAGESFTAARWHVRASRWAGLTQSNEMLRHLRHAIDLLRGIEPTDESRALEASAIGQILWTGPRADTLEGGDELSERAMQLSLSSSDPLVRARLEYGVANWIIFGKHDLVAASERLVGAIALADASGDAELRISTRYSLGLSTFLRSDLATSIEHIESALEIALAHPELNPTFLGYGHVPALHALLAMDNALSGRCSKAAAHCEEAIACALESDAAGRVMAYGFSSFAAGFAGERELALARAQKSFEICEPIKALNIRGVALNALGRAHAMNGHWAEAFELQQRVWTEAIPTQKMLSTRARATFEMESADAAIAAGDELIAFNQRIGARGFECEARLDLADVLARLPTPPLDRIEAELQRAAELIEQTGALTFRPRIHEIRAQLDPAVREAELREALRLYTEMESAHAGRIEQELAAVRLS
jgi:tetratricopeptide (TPR) repeat protein